MEGSFIEIGACLTTNDSGILVRLDCLGEDDRNFCCTSKSVSGFIPYPAQQDCCTYEEYADEHWVTLAVIKVMLILVTTVFIQVSLLLAYFYITSMNISESDIKAHRRIILRELLKQHILRKPPGLAPRAATTLKRASDGSTATIHGGCGKAIQMQPVSDDRKDA